jgi:hypothetical protein
VFDSDSLGKDTSLGKLEFDVFMVKGVKAKWMPLQVRSSTYYYYYNVVLSQDFLFL